MKATGSSDGSSTGKKYYDKMTCTNKPLICCRSLLWKLKGPISYGFTEEGKRCKHPVTCKTGCKMRAITKVTLMFLVVRAYSAPDQQIQQVIDEFLPPETMKMVEKLIEDLSKGDLTDLKKMLNDIPEEALPSKNDIKDGLLKAKEILRDYPAPKLVLEEILKGMKTGSWVPVENMIKNNLPPAVDQDTKNMLLSGVPTVQNVYDGLPSDTKATAQKEGFIFGHQVTFQDSPSPKPP